MVGIRWRIDREGYCSLWTDTIAPFKYLQECGRVELFPSEISVTIVAPLCTIYFPHYLHICYFICLFGCFCHCMVRVDRGQHGQKFTLSRSSQKLLQGKLLTQISSYCIAAHNPGIKEGKTKVLTLETTDSSASHFYYWLYSRAHPRKAAQTRILYSSYTDSLI
jgi:hypothetical protein